MRIKLATLTVAILLLFGPATADAARTYRVKVNSTPAGSSIYLEKTGEVVHGKTPHTLRLPKGQHTLILKLDGYKSVTRTVLVQRTSTFSFNLEKKPEPATFSLEAAPGSQAAGATVKINGKEVGKIPVTVALLQGRYLVAVEQTGFKNWEQWIDVKEAERRSIVVSLVAEAPDTGSLLVSSNVTGAEVYVDGRKVDTAPALVEKLTPGTHMVEVRASGYTTARKDIAIESGKTAKVTVELIVDQATVAANTGTIQVLADPKGVEIMVDGASQGDAPVKVAELAEGTHIIEGNKDGYTKSELSVEIKKGEFKTVKLTLKEEATPEKVGKLQVSSNIKGAKVAVDGKDVGTTPLLLPSVLPGPHVIRVYNDGSQELYKTVEIKAGLTTEVYADLKPGAVTAATTDKPAETTTPETNKAEVEDKVAEEKAKVEENKGGEDEEPVSTLGMSSFGAQLVGRGAFTADFGFGYPYIFEGRLTTGLWESGWFGLDIGIDFRTFGLHNELGFHGNFRVVNYEPVALSVNLEMGGGGGPNNRETFYTNLGVSFSIWFKRIVTFTGRAYMNIFVDDLCDGSDYVRGTAVDGQLRTEITEKLDTCRWPVELSTGAGGETEHLNGWIADGKVSGQLADKEFREKLRGTFTKARFMLSAIIEFPVHDMVNIWAMVEGAPGQGGDSGRWAYRELFSSFMPEDDPAIYGRLGATIKF